MMKIWIWSILSFCLLACNSKKQETIQMLNQWIGKEIVFPNTLKTKVINRDTTWQEFLKKKYKIFLHVDSTGCSECKLQLHAWKNLMESIKHFQDNVAFVYVVHTNNQRELAIICKQNEFDYPILYDIAGKMDKMNHFPQQENYRCFLLDTNNRVLLIGNPIGNTKLWNLYKDIIIK